MLISTPYYRTLAPTNVIGCDDEPDFTYGPYDLFCMETRLYPIVYRMFGRDVEIIFKGVHQNNRMEIKIHLVKITTITTGPIPNEDIDISEEQKIILDRAVSRIVTDNLGYCLIDRNELYISARRNYPRTWFNEVVGYIQISSEYNPFIRTEGIYLTFNPVADFKTAYNDVVKTLLDTLDQFYKDGVVYGAGNIAIPWKLERLDYEEVRPKLYQPTWADKRFGAHLAEFIQAKINGDPYIRLKVSDNLVKRHYISSSLSQEGITMIFEGSHIKIPVDNLDDAQYVASLVVSSQRVAEGKVVTYATNRLSWVYLYIDAANELLDSPGCTGYQTSDTEKPFMFSCLIDRNVSIATVLNELEQMVWGRLKEIAGKKEGSPHDTVISQYTS